MLLYVLVSIIALWKYRFYKHTGLRFFLMYVFIQMITETVGLYLGKKFGANAWWYSCMYLVTFLYVYVLFREGIKTLKYQVFITYTMYLFVLSFAVFAFLFGFGAVSNTIIYIIGASFGIFTVILYYVDILKTNEIVAVKTNLLFWVSVGLLLLYVGYVPIKSIYLVSDDLASLDVFKAIHYTLIIIMNLCFITGFLLVKPRMQP